MVCLEHYAVSNVGHIVHSFKRGSTWHSVWPIVLLPKPVVMIGNMLLEPEAAHNQTLPNSTFYPLLGLQEHWCFWSLGAGPYQLLPIFTMVQIWVEPLAYVPLPVDGLR